MLKKSLLFSLSLFLFGCATDSTSSFRVDNSRAGLARQILENPAKYKFASYHLSGVKDQATALINMQATAAGYSARRSSYAKAPGGSCYLQENMLRGMISLGREYSISISEVAGGGHSATSRHYLGVAYDVTHINGVKVSWSNPYYRAYMSKARALGATEVLGPGDRNHNGHLHIAWPRPAGQ